MNEQKITASNYIISFYQEVENLTHNHAIYINLLIELKAKYGEKPDAKKITEEEYNVLSTTVQTVRYYCTKAYIKYNSISNQFQKNEDVKKQYDLIKSPSNYLIDSEKLESFVTLMNNIIVDKVIRNLLKSSQDFVSEIYNYENENKK